MNQKPVVYLDEALGAFYWPHEYTKDVGFTPLYGKADVKCTCGDLTALGVVHCDDGPCYYPEDTDEKEKRAWDAGYTYAVERRKSQQLTIDDVNSWELPERPTVFEFAKFVESKINEKDT